jgi:hypothetical protein
MKQLLKQKLHLNMGSKGNEMATIITLPMIKKTQLSILLKLPSHRLTTNMYFNVSTHYF